MNQRKEQTTITRIRQSTIARIDAERAKRGVTQIRMIEAALTAWLALPYEVRTEHLRK